MTRWMLFVCSDCETDDGVLVHPVPEDASHERSCNVDYCPGCGSHLSMLGMGDVDVGGRSLVHLRMRATK